MAPKEFIESASAFRPTGVHVVGQEVAREGGGVQIRAEGGSFSMALNPSRQSDEEE